MKRLIFTLLLVGFVGIHLNCASSPDARAQQEKKEAIEQEIKYGRLLASQILKKVPLLPDEKVSNYVALVGKSVAMYAGRDDFPYHFAVLDTYDINAFATPGGYVFITKGAIMKMKNEAELAGTLAHEIAHINQKHILKELPPPRETGGFINTIAAVLSSQSAGVSSAFGETIKAAENTLFLDGYKREAEFEADKYGTMYLSNTGYSPQGLIDFLRVINEMEQQMGKEHVYHTHPKTTDRIAAVENQIKEEGLGTGPVLKERFDEMTGHLQ